MEVHRHRICHAEIERGFLSTVGSVVLYGMHLVPGFNCLFQVMSCEIEWDCLG